MYIQAFLLWNVSPPPPKHRRIREAGNVVSSLLAKQSQPIISSLRAQINQDRTPLYQARPFKANIPSKPATATPPKPLPPPSQKKLLYSPSSLRAPPRRDSRPNTKSYPKQLTLPAPPLSSSSLPPPTSSSPSRSFPPSSSSATPAFPLDLMPTYPPPKAPSPPPPPPASHASLMSALLRRKGASSVVKRGCSG